MMPLRTMSLCWHLRPSKAGDGGMINDTSVGDVLIVKPTKQRLDTQEAGSFKEHMGQRIHAGHMQIVLDLSRVEFIDSSGLGAIVSSLKMLGGNGSLSLCGIRDTIMSM